MARGGTCMSSNLMHVVEMFRLVKQSLHSLAVSDTKFKQTFSTGAFELQHIELVACLQVRYCTLSVQAEVEHRAVLDAARECTIAFRSGIKFTVAPNWNEASNNSGFQRIEAVVIKSTEVSGAQLVTVAGLRHEVQEIVYTGSEEPHRSVRATGWRPPPRVPHCEERPGAVHSRRDQKCVAGLRSTLKKSFWEFLRRWG